MLCRSEHSSGGTVGQTTRNNKSQGPSTSLSAATPTPAGSTARRAPSRLVGPRASSANCKLQQSRKPTSTSAAGVTPTVRPPPPVRNTSCTDDSTTGNTSSVTSSVTSSSDRPGHVTAKPSVAVVRQLSSAVDVSRSSLFCSET